MLKANFKNVFFITLVSTLVFLTGCTSPEEKRAATIEKALELNREGSSQEALSILEELAAEYPNDAEILYSIGRIYAIEDDHTMAAFFLEQAHLQSPDDIELLYQTYVSLEAANQPAGHLLEKLAEQSPETMTPELWISLGQDRMSENRVQPALDAYLKGVDPEKAKPSAETAAAIGQLFARLGNLAQAEEWLEIAADNDDPNALTALFGLLEIRLRQKDWAGAEATIAQLDQQFPGAVAASQWEQARQELIKWREAQDKMREELARAEAERKAAEEAAAAAQIETTDAETNESDTSASDPESRAEGKAQVIADMEAAEAMADAPAIEIEDTASEITEVETEDTIEISSVETGNGKTITYDPSIAIEPADPEITFEVAFDQSDVAVPTTYSVEETETEAVGADPAPEVLFPTVENTQPEPVRASEGPKTIEELLADAETAEIDRDFKSAIRKYWAAISITNNRADIWNLLSRAYLVDGQLENAETAALEAVRLNPREVAYTLDYLRVAQRSKTPESFLAELETAYDRFPASPEITLSLARAYERIAKNNFTARSLYLRFIDIAPNHPLVPEAESAAARLR